jgi:L-rhamnose isomerase
MMEEKVKKNYEAAVERYAGFGVDVEKALNTLQQIPLSLHCWQTDDVAGFENTGGSLTGGIQATGNYPGKARNIAEVRADIEKTVSLIPGKHRLSLHAIYGDFGGQKVDRDQIEPRHFQSWIDWAKEKGLKLDFNSTSFSHPKSGDMTLAHRDKGIRDFWIEHTIRSRRIAEEMGKQLGAKACHNLWVHDGAKDITVDRYLYRKNLKDSLDKIFAVKLPNVKDAVECKLFGTGLESFTVGSHEFYMGYAVQNGIMATLDMGHFHPTEEIYDKISALLLFMPEILLHVSRPVRWDSDHVVILNDSVLMLAQEIVRANALSRTNIGLDYFDASINRIGAYVIGSRATQKALLQALLEPIDQLRRYEADGRYFERLALLEEAKSLPWSAVYDYFCVKNNILPSELYISEIERYEKDVLSKR